MNRTELLHYIRKLSNAFDEHHAVWHNTGETLIEQVRDHVQELGGLDLVKSLSGERTEGTQDAVKRVVLEAEAPMAISDVLEQLIVLDLSKSQVSYALRQLCERGELQMTGQRKDARYTTP